MKFSSLERAKRHHLSASLPPALPARLGALGAPLSLPGRAAAGAKGARLSTAHLRGTGRPGSRPRSAPGGTCGRQRAPCATGVRPAPGAAFADVIAGQPALKFNTAAGGEDRRCRGRRLQQRCSAAGLRGQPRGSPATQPPAPPCPRSPSPRARPRGPYAGRPRACTELGGDLGGAGGVSWTGADPAAARRSALAFPRISAARANAYKCIWEPRGQGEDASLPRNKRKREPGRRDGGPRCPGQRQRGAPHRYPTAGWGSRPGRGWGLWLGYPPGAEGGDPGRLSLNPDSPSSRCDSGRSRVPPEYRRRLRGAPSAEGARLCQWLCVRPLRALLFLDAPRPVQQAHDILPTSKPTSQQAAWLGGALPGEGCAGAWTPGSRAA